MSGKKEKKMRVVLGQLGIEWEDKEASLKKAGKMIENASRAGGDIILFPEMTCTGFSMDLEKIGEPEESSQTVASMQKMARQYHIAVGFGWSSLGEGSDGKGKNQFTLVDASGKKLAEYCKLHPFSYGRESLYYEKGKEIVTVPFMGRTVGLFICYDLWFPEIFQIAARKADILFIIANWPASRIVQWEILLRARAVETQSYVVGVNCFGEQGGAFYSGSSMAVDAMGNVIGEICNCEGILVCDLDDRAWHLRGKFALVHDRRENFYKQYYW